jgi:hypothetical protein
MDSYLDYHDNIAKDIAKEFGLESIGYGSNRLDVSKASEYLAKWNALSEDEQNSILSSRYNGLGFKL